MHSEEWALGDKDRQRYNLINYLTLKLTYDDALRSIEIVRPSPVTSNNLISLASFLFVNFSAFITFEKIILKSSLKK
jgi:hypothetical protein